MKDTEIKKLMKKSLEEKLSDIDSGNPVACHHLRFTRDHYFCEACCDAKQPEKCIYSIEKQEDPATYSITPFYANRCYQLRPDDLKLILLSRNNHLFPINGNNKNKKLTDFDDNE